MKGIDRIKKYENHRLSGRNLTHLEIRNKTKVRGQQTNNQLKIAHLSTYDTGGAGAAALRLHKKLIEYGFVSKFYAKELTHKSPEAFSINLGNYQLIDKILTQYFVNGENTYESNTMFTPSFTYINNERLSFLKDFDVIHIHWIQMFLSTENISYILSLQKKIVWTFHDKNPLSGGCHNFHGCTLYLLECIDCPQLKNNFKNFPHHTFNQKLILLDNIPTIVCLSNHYKSYLDRSLLYRNAKKYVIPNVLNLGTFSPNDMIKSRKILNLPQDAKVLLFVSDGKPSIKGLDDFKNVFNNVARNDKGCLALFVGRFKESDFLGLTNFLNFGYITNEKELSLIYSASNITIIPSYEESFSNVALESLSSGTPVVGYKVGIIPELVIDAVNGFSVDVGDVLDLSTKIRRILDVKISAKNRSKMVPNEYSSDTVIERYIELYMESDVSVDNSHQINGHEMAMIRQNYDFLLEALFLNYPVNELVEFSDSSRTARIKYLIKNAFRILRFIFFKSTNSK